MVDASPYQEKKIPDPATGRQKITRHIEENGHPVLSQAVFIQYATARVEAAKSLLKKEDKENSELNQLLTYIELYFSQPQDAIEENKFKKAKQALTEASEDQKKSALKEYNTAFDAYYKYNIKKCQKINRLLVYHLNPEISNKEKFKAVMKKIEAECSNLKAETKRPIQENNYNTSGLKVTSSHIPEGEFNAAQKKLYENLHEKSPEDRVYTTPSTIRDKRQIGQVNALQTEIKIGDKVVFSGHRHGSPCPYKIEDDAERQYRTLQNIKQTMAIAAKEKIEALKKEQRDLKEKNPKDETEEKRLKELTEILENKTLTLDISSMSLLSPVNDTLDKSDKQVRQVNDSRLAYWSLQGREIPLDIPGEPGFTVKLNSTFMTMGVNAARGIEGPEAAALIKRVNNRGLNNLIENFIKDLSLNPNNDPNSIETKIKNIEDSNKDIIACKEAIKNFDYNTLHDAYAKLDAISENLSNRSTPEEIKKEEIKKREAILKTIDEQERIREAILKTIDKQESILDKHHEALANARKAAYKKALPAFQLELKALENQNINPPLPLKTRLFVNALDTFYKQPKVGIVRAVAQKISPDHTRNKGNYEFQSQFALLAHNRGEFVEWFCKSGEDRTGLLNEYIEAYCIFIEKNGRPPIWNDEKDEQALQAIMPHVHNGAPNRESNGFNDDSPGLKVSNADINLSRAQLDYKPDKKVGKIKDEAGLKIKKLPSLDLDLFKEIEQKIKEKTEKKSEAQSKPENANRPLLFSHPRIQTGAAVIAAENLAEATNLSSTNHAINYKNSENQKLQVQLQVQPSEKTAQIVAASDIRLADPNIINSPFLISAKQAIDELVKSATKNTVFKISDSDKVLPELKAELKKYLETKLLEKFPGQKNITQNISPSPDNKPVVPKLK